MADSENKLTKLEHLKKLATKTKEELDALARNIESKGYQTESDVAEFVNSKIGSAYRPAGSVGADRFDEAPTEDDLGKVYNVTESFFTNKYFIEGSDKQYSAGTDVAVIEDGGEYYYNVMANFVDLDAFPTNTELDNKLRNYLTKSEADNFVTAEELGEYLTEDDIASNEDVDEMLGTVFDEK